MLTVHWKGIVVLGEFCSDMEDRIQEGQSLCDEIILA